MQETDDCQPVTWVGKVPVYLTTILVALYSAAFLGTAVAWIARVNLSYLMLIPDQVLHGALWQPLTYTFIHPLTFFSAISLFFLYMMAVQVEMYLGRRRLAAMYLAFVLAPAVFLVVYHYGTPGAVYDGTFFLSAGFFIAFATLYPGVEFFGLITMRWLAPIVFVLVALSCMTAQQWGELGGFLLVCSLSFSYVRILQRGGWGEVSRGLWERLKPRPRVILPFRKVPPRQAGEEEDVIEAIDPLLEKISKHGINSLTPKELAKLERARLALLKKG